MPDMKEVYEMVTQQTPPKPGALQRQNRKQRRRSTRRKAGVYGLVATLMILAGVLTVRSLADNDAQQVIPGSTATPTATPVPSSGLMKPGTYAFSTLDPDFDASYRITMDIPVGYKGYGGYAVIKLGENQGMSTWVVGNVYADPCHWIGTLLDPPVGSSVDGLVAALAGQKGHPASTPTDVTVDGFTGKYMEMTVPARINLADCDGGQFRTWLDTDGGERFLDPGQRDLLWIVDVNGTPLVIDASLGAGTSAQDRAERIQIVNSVRIDPR
jgi:hypothetical protein